MRLHHIIVAALCCQSLLFAQLPIETPANRDAFKTALLLNNVNNTSDSNKPLSTAAQAVAPFNVKTYGAVGNGVANDTTAVHAARDACLAAGGNGVLFFPPGTYKGSFVFTGKIHIIGSGAGSVGDWQLNGTEGRTVLIPNDNSLPAVRCYNLSGMKMEKFDIKGNGAGTSLSGIQVENTTLNAFAGNGLFVFDVMVRRFTSAFRSLGGCNIEFSHCGLFQATTAIDIPDLTFAHSYTFNLCSLGGFVELTGTIPPASPLPSRIINLAEGSFVTFVNCELGNCKEWGYSRGIFNVYGGNTETVTGNPMLTVNSGQFYLTGTRIATGDRTFVRTTGGNGDVTGISFVGAMAFGAMTLHEGNGWFAKPFIKGSGFGKRVRTYNSDFTVLLEDSIADPAVVKARLTATQTNTGSGVFPVIFNVEDADQTSKYNTTNGKFIPSKRGYYRISAAIRISGVIGGYAVLYAMINGSSQAVLCALTSGGAGTVMSGSTVVYMQNADEANISIQNGGTHNVDAVDNYTSTVTFEEIPW